MRFFWCALLASVWLSAFGSDAQAMQIELPESWLCETATVIAVVEPTSTETRWTENGENLETSTWAHVAEFRKGSTGKHTVELRTEGGVLPSGLTQWVEHQPIFVLDKRVLVFLRPIEGGWQVVGGEQGVRSAEAPVCGGGL